LHALIAIYQEDDELWIDPYLTFPETGPLAFDGTGSGAGQVVSKYIWLFTAYLWLSWAFVVDPGAHVSDRRERKKLLLRRVCLGAQFISLSHPLRSYWYRFSD
jgi:hypothetical protein